MPRKGDRRPNHVWPKKPAAKGFGSGRVTAAAARDGRARLGRLEARMDALPVAGRQHRLAGLCRGRAAEKLAAGQPAAERRPSTRRPGRPRPSSGQIVLESKGHIIPAHQILVSPKVSGMVVKLLITESQRVGRGDVLAESEEREYRADATRPPRRRNRRAEPRRVQRGLQPEEIEQTRPNWPRSGPVGLAEGRLPPPDSPRTRWDLRRSRCGPGRVRGHATPRPAAGIGRQAGGRGPAGRADRRRRRPGRPGRGRSWPRPSGAPSNCVIRRSPGRYSKRTPRKATLVNPVAMQGFYSLCEMADLSDLEVKLMIPEREVSKISNRAAKSAARPCQPRLQRLRLAADAHGRPQQGRHSRPREAAQSPPTKKASI